MSKHQRELFSQIYKKPIYFFEDVVPFACQQFIRIMAIEDSLMACQSQKGENKAYLITRHNLIIAIVEDEPECTNECPNVGQDALKIAKDCGWDE